MNDAYRPPWFDADALPGRPAGARWQALLDRPGIVSVPGAQVSPAHRAPLAPHQRTANKKGNPNEQNHPHLV